MKGRTRCPKCNNEYILDIPEDIDKYNTVCPKCNNKFIIKKSINCKELEDECIWEEHGEPRKTILSSIKPNTDKPMIAAIMLFFVFIIGLISAITIQIYPNIYYEFTFNLFSNFDEIGFLNNLDIILTILILIFSLFALIGSIASIKRMKFYIVIISSFLGIFTMSFFFIGSLLTIIAIILIFYSKEEFTNEKKGKNF